MSYKLPLATTSNHGVMEVGKYLSVINGVVSANIATTTSLGVVQIGANIHVTPEGVISVSDASQCKCKRILISEDYVVQEDDYYIGVNSTDSVKITLPNTNERCGEIIIKSEMKPPLGKRKITIVTVDGMIDNVVQEYLIEVPYQSAHFICRDGNWYVV